MSIKMEINESDKEMLNIFSKNAAGKYILWAIVHSDMLSYIDAGPDHELTTACIEECERELVLRR